jgi:hypothetical protein
MITPQNMKRKWRIVDISEPMQPKPKPLGAWGAKPAPKPQIISQRRGGTQNKIGEQMDNWFYTSFEDDVSPFVFTTVVADNFLKEMQDNRLELVHIPSAFIKKVCTAVSAYVYYDYFEQKTVGVPRNIQKVPKGWTNQTENIWFDFIQSRFLNDTFFDRFWHALPPTIWEEGYPRIRDYLQSILPYFLKFDNELLIEHELIAVNSDGEFVDPAEADFYEEEGSAWD